MYSHQEICMITTKRRDHSIPEDSFDKSKTNRVKQAKACQNKRRLKSTLQIKNAEVYQKQD
jgi:hypothetical protein